MLPSALISPWFSAIKSGFTSGSGCTASIGWADPKPKIGVKIYGKNKFPKPKPIPLPKRWGILTAATIIPIVLATGISTNHPGRPPHSK